MKSPARRGAVPSDGFAHNEAVAPVGHDKVSMTDIN
jgi:hypothetical protein